MMIPAKGDAGYQAWVDATVADGARICGRARAAGAGRADRQDLFLAEAAEMAATDPSLVPALIRKAFDMGLADAPAIAETLRRMAA